MPRLNRCNNYKKATWWMLPCFISRHWFFPLRFVAGEFKVLSVCIVRWGQFPKGIGNELIMRIVIKRTFREYNFDFVIWLWPSFILQDVNKLEKTKIYDKCVCVRAHFCVCIWECMCSWSHAVMSGWMRVGSGCGEEHFMAALFSPVIFLFSIFCFLFMYIFVFNICAFEWCFPLL